jgi:hypothetical protein
MVVSELGILRHSEMRDMLPYQAAKAQAHCARRRRTSCYSQLPGATNGRRILNVVILFWSFNCIASKFSSSSLQKESANDSIVVPPEDVDHCVIASATQSWLACGSTTNQMRDHGYDPTTENSGL